jgi:hypothetical protein
MATAGTSAGGIHRGNCDELASGPAHLVFKLAPVF